MNERTLTWFRLHEGTYVDIPAGEDGIFRSQVFPGLWLDENAFWADDMATLVSTLQAGMASPAYQAFVATLATR